MEEFKKKNKYVKNKQQFLDISTLTDQQKESRANNLIFLPVDHVNILGYVAADIRGEISYCKFNKGTEEIVYFDKNKKVLSYGHRSYREFQDKKWEEYSDELN